MSESADSIHGAPRPPLGGGGGGRGGGRGTKRAGDTGTGTGTGTGSGTDRAALIAARAAFLLGSEVPLLASDAALARVRTVVLADPAPRPRHSPVWRVVPSPRSVALATLTAAALVLWWGWGSAPRDLDGRTTAPSLAPPAMPPVATTQTTGSRAAIGASPVAASASTATTTAAPDSAGARATPTPRGPVAAARLHATSRAAPVPTTPASRAAPAATTAVVTATPTSAPAAPAALGDPVDPVVVITPGTVPAATPTHDTTGAELLVQATRHLRHDDDAAGARALVERYLADHPGGPLTEEALYLDVEIADALADGTLARAAARYLQRFPAGRLRSAVVRLRDGR